jgi:hypothetical protein
MITVVRRHSVCLLLYACPSACLLVGRDPDSLVLLVFFLGETITGDAQEQQSRDEDILPVREDKGICWTLRVAELSSSRTEEQK